MERTLVTAENIEEIKGQLPTDQAEELVVGCESWTGINANGHRYYMTIWPNGRGAICWGGDSVWGDWSEYHDTLIYDENT